MHLRHLRLLDFRSWPLLELELEPGVTTLVGRNGHGKTNVLEAVGVLASLRSHRVATDTPMIRTGAGTALVGALAHNAGRELTVELALNSGKANRARLNTSPCRRLSDVLGVVQSVLFAPEDLALVRGEPAERRRLLDELMIQRRPALGGDLSEYSSVLRQRTALLKSASGALRRGGPKDSATVLDTLDVWDGRLAELGARVVAGRIALLRQPEARFTALAEADARPVLVVEIAGGLRDVERLEQFLVEGPGAVRHEQESWLRQLQEFVLYDAKMSRTQGQLGQALTLYSSIS